MSCRRADRARRRSDARDRLADRARCRATRARSTRCARSSSAIVDQGSFFEIGKLLGPLGHHRFRAPRRLAGGADGGRPVCTTAAPGPRAPREKVMRFVDLAQTFHLPVVHLVDCPGFLIGPEAEKEGTIRYGMRAASAILPVDGAVVLGDRAQGLRRRRGAHQNSARYGMRYAWPSAEWGSLPIAGGLEAAYRARDRGRARPGGQARRDRAAHPQVRLADARRRALRHRGDHRSARHAPDPLRVRRPGRAAAHPRAKLVRGSSVKSVPPVGIRVRKGKFVRYRTVRAGGTG